MLNGNQNDFNFTFYGHLMEYCKKNNINMESILSYKGETPFINMTLFCEDSLSSQDAEDLVDTLGRTKDYWSCVHAAYYNHDMKYLYKYRNDNDGCGLFKLINMYHEALRLENQTSDADLLDIKPLDVAKVSFRKTITFFLFCFLVIMKTLHFATIPLVLFFVFKLTSWQFPEYSMWSQLGISAFINIALVPVFYFFFCYFEILCNKTIIKVKSYIGERKY